MSVGADVECGEDVSRDHSREECECLFVIVSVTLVAECVHGPSLHGPEGVEEEEREEECRPEEGQAQDDDVPLTKTGPGRARRRRRSVKTNEFSDERPTAEGRNDDDNNQQDNRFPKERIENGGEEGRTGETLAITEEEKGRKGCRGDGGRKEGRKKGRKA